MPLSTAKTFNISNKINLNSNLKPTCFEAIIKLINTHFQKVLSNKSIKCNNIVLGDNITYNEELNSLIITQPGIYLLMYQIYQQDTSIQLGIYLNKKLVDIGIKCTDNHDNFFDMTLITIEKENLETGSANIQIISQGFGRIKIDGGKYSRRIFST